MIILGKVDISINGFPSQKKDVFVLSETFVIRGTTVKLIVRNRNSILAKHCN